MKGSIFLLAATFSGVVPGHRGPESHPLACVEVVDRGSVSYRQGREDALRDAAIGACVRRGKLRSDLARCADEQHNILTRLADEVPK